jgi:hypothetical protein
VAVLDDGEGLGQGGERTKQKKRGKNQQVFHHGQLDTKTGIWVVVLTGLPIGCKVLDSQVSKTRPGAPGR